MWDFIANTLLPFVGTFVVGVLGWIATHFLANPLLKFYKTREQIHEALFFTANVSNREIDSEKYDESVSELRRSAARVNALAHSFSLPVSWFLKWRHYDLREAIAAITGLSNTLHDQTGEKAAHRYDVEKSLKFPSNSNKRPTVRE